MQTLMKTTDYERSDSHSDQQKILNNLNKEILDAVSSGGTRNEIKEEGRKRREGENH